jgi:anti-anti-sigma factor
MKIHFSVQQGIVVVAPQGRITVENEPELTNAVRQLHSSGSVQLVLSFEGVAGLDSCGLGAVAQAFVSTWSRGGMLKIAAVGARTRKLFDITALGTVIEIYPSVAEAVASFGLPPRRERDDSEPVSLTVGG